MSVRNDERTALTAEERRQWERVLYEQATATAQAALTYGDITRSSEPFWRANVLGPGQPFTAAQMQAAMDQQRPAWVAQMREAREAAERRYEDYLARIERFTTSDLGAVLNGLKPRSPWMRYDDYRLHVEAGL